MKRVMTVDDSASVRMMISVTLKGAGFDVIEACDALEALKKIARTDVQALVVDLNMPGMGGLDLVRKLRQTPGYLSTPIIMVTTEGSMDLIEKGKDAGATGWMVKPFSPEQLVNVIRSVIP